MSVSISILGTHLFKQVQAYPRASPSAIPEVSPKVAESGFLGTRLGVVYPQAPRLRKCSLAVAGLVIGHPTYLQTYLLLS